MTPYVSNVVFISYVSNFVCLLRLHVVCYFIRKSKSCKSAVGVSTGLSLPEDKSLNEVIETEDSKKKADLLWADFMKDVGKPQPKVQVSGNSVKTESSKCNTTVKVNITSP